MSTEAIRAKSPHDPDFRLPNIPHRARQLLRRELQHVSGSVLMVHTVFANRTKNRFWYVESYAGQHFMRRAASSTSAAVAAGWMFHIEKAHQEKA
jgi:hypothetical protein